MSQILTISTEAASRCIDIDLSAIEDLREITFEQFANRYIRPAVTKLLAEQELWLRDAN